MSIVRENIIADPNYRPYCGSVNCRKMPRTKKESGQFICPSCGWKSTYESEFSDKYIRL